MGKQPDPLSRALKAMSTDVPDIPQDALFDMERPKRAGDDLPKKATRAKTIRSMPCPECMAQKVGVVRVYDRDIGQHVELLKRHDRVTRKGHRMHCPASNRRVDE